MDIVVQSFCVDSVVTLPVGPLDLLTIFTVGLFSVNKFFVLNNSFTGIPAVLVCRSSALFTPLTLGAFTFENYLCSENTLHAAAAPALPVLVACCLCFGYMLRA